MAEACRYHVEGTVGVITLDRPANRNSMTVELLDAFTVASKAALSDRDVRCIVVTGTGACFSAGADFNAIVQRGGGEPHERSFEMYKPFLSILDLDVPVVGALNGHAIGGGFGLALLCDVRIGAREGKYGANFVRLGIGPGMAISYMLPRLIGLARASELLLTGRLVDGAEAERLGILNRAVDAADVLAQAMALAQEIAAAAPLAVRATKKAIRRGLDLNARSAALTEAFAQAETLATDDAREGITALLAKRTPSFTGK